MFNNYPYTDYHELNTDWIIGKIKNVETAEANTKQYAEDADAAKVAAEDARDIAVQAKDDAVEAKDDAVEAKDDAISFLTDTKDQLDLLQARVDNIIPDGTQTAGNLELLDIRVAYDGTTYASAGDAVRGQAEELNDKISVLGVDSFYQGYVNIKGQINTTDTNYKRTAFIPCFEGTDITASSVMTSNTAMGAVVFFDTNKNYLTSTNVNTGEATVTVTAPTDAAFVIFNMGSSQSVKFSFDNSSIGDVIAEHIPEVGYSWTTGYFISNSNGRTYSDANFAVTGYIPVSEGQTVTCYGKSNNFIYFVNYYDRNHNFMGGDGLSTNYTVNSYTVPEGCCYIRGCTATEAKAPYVTVSDVRQNNINNLNGKVMNRTETVSYQASLGSGASITLNTCDAKNKYNLSFVGHPTTFDTLELYVGETATYASSKVTITASNVVVSIKMGATWSDIYTEAHGLTIDGVLAVNICVESMSAVKISLATDTGAYFKELPYNWMTYGFMGSYGQQIKCTSVNSAFTEVYFGMNHFGLESDLWAFGDSYFGTWPSIVENEYGQHNAYYDAYSGRGSSRAYDSLVECLKYKTPKCVLWCMGMNDPDTISDINSAWQAAADKVIALSKEYNFDLIFSTIPNTPTRLHTFKNAYIAASGEKYVDLAQILGADTAGSPWITGLLSGDDVHPSAIGSYVIANAMMSNVPYIIG